MSNLIKSSSIYVKQEETCTIDSNQFAFEFQPLKTSSLAQLEARSTDSSNAERLTKDLSEEELQKIVDEEEQFIHNRVEQILEDAKKEADQIRANAKEEAKSIHERAQDEGMKKGYVDGLQSGTDELKRLEQELKEQIATNQDSVEKELQQMEQKLVDVIVQTLQQITGILIEDKQEVILHLIKRTLNHMDKQKEYMIQVSPDDYEVVSQHKKELMDMIGENVLLEVLADQKLEKNQCLIETESNIFDCSLDVQLSNLSASLKLLARI